MPAGGLRGVVFRSTTGVSSRPGIPFGGAGSQWVSGFSRPVGVFIFRGMSFAATSSGLLVPAPRLTCCSMCGERVPDSQFPGHAERCYRAHEDMVQEELEVRETEPWNVALDPEKEAWARERGVMP